MYAVVFLVFGGGSVEITCAIYVPYALPVWPIKDILYNNYYLHNNWAYDDFASYSSVRHFITICKNVRFS